jgi:uncharacterized membrane protein YccC
MVLASPTGLCHAACMTDRSTYAGGFVLVLAIFAGFALGALYDAALFGTLAGTLVGIAAATLLWLRDRKRDRD